jgi:hypothetical protein
MGAFFFAVSFWVDLRGGFWLTIGCLLFQAESRRRQRNDRTARWLSIDSSRSSGSRFGMQGPRRIWGFDAETRRNLRCETRLTHVGQELSPSRARSWLQFGSSLLSYSQAQSGAPLSASLPNLMGAYLWEVGAQIWRLNWRVQLRAIGPSGSHGVCLECSRVLA